MELVAAARIDQDTLEVTLADGIGLVRLEADSLEIAVLCDAMEQAAVLARASDRMAWLTELTLGDTLVRLGIGRGRVRMVTGPAG